MEGLISNTTPAAVVQSVIWFCDVDVHGATGPNDSARPPPIVQVAACIDIQTWI